MDYGSAMITIRLFVMILYMLKVWTKHTVLTLLLEECYDTFGAASHDNNG